MNQINPKVKKVQLQRASQTSEGREFRLRQMRVTSAVSRSAENEDEREGRLKRMWISASASNAAENQKNSRTVGWSKCRIRHLHLELQKMKKNLFIQS